MLDGYSFDGRIHYVNRLLQIEEIEGRKVNGLEDIADRRARQAEIRFQWDKIKEKIRAIQDRVDGLPLLPAQEHIDWAQSVQAMASLRFLEVDTTGVDLEAEIVRISLAGPNGITFDQLIKPERAHISKEANKRNDLTDADVVDAPQLEEVWPKLQRAFQGTYILAFNLEWDIKTLAEAAKSHGLPPLIIIGECLQRRSTAYYFREYYLDLAEVAARMGHVLESWDAPTRLQAQWTILDGIAHGIRDVRPPKTEPEPAETATNSESFLGEENGLGDLDDHPF